MNNEEKILEMLGKHGELLEKLTGDVASLKAAQEEIRGDISEMQTTLTRAAVTQEGVVLPRLQLLYEGQVHLQETLAPKERVEVLEDEVITIKSMLKSMSKRLSALEKAQ